MRCGSRGTDARVLFTRTPDMRLDLSVDTLRPLPTLISKATNTARQAAQPPPVPVPWQSDPAPAACWLSNRSPALDPLHCAPVGP
ncbi:hypothetical protein GCM10010329_51140 [Streptomyces spiroverticillatus]|uniref:Uncharacterized protein n=1 Tax=Streptomyces finlayi TaxID=67296 RepID=A0A919CBX2_9ACTN|nr:hypothetical protein GCM10010329_51140 [Streptomyces spiroverticillatus]GHD03921.1 hypothetical protein GCM10010334_52090 [Streptomyces finlayi]